MRTVVADTFYFLALLNRTDSAHAQAVAFTSSNTVRMVTTGGVVTELADAVAGSPRGRFNSCPRSLTSKPTPTPSSCRAAIRS
jgi:hypothetical protein